MMIPVAPGKKNKTAFVVVVVVVTTIQKSMCSVCIGGSWCVHCLQWSEHQKKGVNRKLLDHTARAPSGKGGHPI